MRTVDTKRLEELGFERDGDLLDADGTYCIMYQDEGEWRMALILPNGSALECEVGELVAFSPCDH